MGQQGQRHCSQLRPAVDPAPGARYCLLRCRQPERSRRRTDRRRAARPHDPARARPAGAGR
ncbi:hypothetical protein O164_21925 [Pseudomonas taiwanensis SJ9]|uniref:Uncharacterized protein n=1 Tax=Pseudomonas taiwanensis SJ9 TaxID=1388762 RepID=V7D7X5_9PSED|nr:hypothetical protein O164_21925 [Pseudomonas taiwanensis SJ9]